MFYWDKIKIYVKNNSIILLKKSLLNNKFIIKRFSELSLIVDSIRVNVI